MKYITHPTLKGRIKCLACGKTLSPQDYKGECPRPLPGAIGKGHTMIFPGRGGLRWQRQRWAIAPRT